MGMGSRGGGGAFRYFFGDQIGFNANVGWYRATPRKGSTFVAAPSFVYMITKSRQLADIDLRPYVGGGLNYTSTSVPVRTNTASLAAHTSGLGMQVFGGVEMSFLSAKSMAISAEVAHYNMVANDFASGLTQGHRLLHDAALLLEVAITAQGGVAGTSAPCGPRTVADQSVARRLAVAATSETRSTPSAARAAPSARAADSPTGRRSPTPVSPSPRRSPRARDARAGSA